MENEMIISEGADREELIELPITTVLGQPVTSKPKAIDEEMVKKATDGDEKAFEQLFMATYGYVYMIAKKRLSHDDDIYDAIQETFTKVYKNLSRLSSAAAFLSWLKAIAENTVTDILRKAPPETEEFFDEYAEVDENYNSKKFDREVNLDITEVLNNLSQDKVDLLIRVYYDGMTVTDIAKKEGVPKTTVYSRLSVAKKELKELLKIRGITKAIYGGSAVAMFATVIRNAIGTDLLSLAVAEEILHTVVSGDKKRAAVISGVTKKMRSEAALRIASKILVFCTAVILIIAILLYTLSGGNILDFPVYDTASNNLNSSANSSRETLWDKLFGEDENSYESSSNADITSYDTLSYEGQNSSDTSSERNNSSTTGSSVISEIPDTPNVNTSSNTSSGFTPNISAPDYGSGFIADCDEHEFNTVGVQPWNVNSFINKQADWLYYSSESGIYKVKTDGSRHTKLSDDMAYNINVVGNCIYYEVNNRIMRMLTDGSDKAVIYESTTSISSLQVRGDMFYFREFVDDPNNWNLMCLDGSTGQAKRILSDITDGNIVVTDNTIFYMKYTPGSLYSLYAYNIDSKKETLLESSVFNYDSLIVTEREVIVESEDRVLRIYNVDDLKYTKKMDEEYNSVFLYIPCDGGKTLIRHYNYDWVKVLETEEIIKSPFAWNRDLLTFNARRYYAAFDDGYIYYLNSSGKLQRCLLGGSNHKLYD